MATLGLSEAEKTAVEAFRRDVVEPSMTQLVIVDFWAEWCGPCKQLSPVIEKIATEYASKGVKLVKINVDENRFIANQFRVQSIPTVYALFQGQPVADLTSARTEGQYRQMLDQLLGQLPVQSPEKSAAEQIAPLLAMGEEVLANGDAQRALSIFTQIIEMAPGNAEAQAGQLRALVAMGEISEAELIYAELPEDMKKNAAMGRVRSALDLAQAAKPIDNLAELQQRVASNPDDHAARFELAGGLMAQGDNDGAANALLEIIRRDRDWNDAAARGQLLKLFEVVGLEDPWVSAQRRRLSAILFG
ncbi:tetratricopeptide repeat protein [Rhizorhapis suberifaciens]|uniref:Putative thioredoxin n=1 Tax=Rhizorhapis suberifaciens TaxID=13656 RepID=A0A840HUN6_9SPHN|nr:tetratricopeptide repeat protein [Rhizorhapis suberifaciens]MBB4641184.1 putative thioredoxin [Rhizorhapis suberifaciens]